MDFLFNQNEDENTSFKTIFGFDTHNKFAAQALNFVYVIVMIVSIAFAHYALGLILIDWPSFIVFLSALSVVGLPYCIKIILYGRKQFTAQMAMLCIAVSVLPTIFDFIGFYAKTSVHQSLVETKFSVLEKINYFDKEARQEINQKLLSLDQQHTSELSKLDGSINERKKAIAKQVVEAEQLYLDETQGVPGKVTSGKPGDGPKARELESEIRKREADAALESQNLSLEKQREEEKIKSNYEAERQNLLNAITAINQLTDSQSKDALIFSVSGAKSFDELATSLIKLNTGINVISSKLDISPEYVKFSTENIVQLSFGALFRGEITALICMTLAILLEIVDTVIVYMIRGERKPKTKEASGERNIRETIKYS